MTPVRPWASGAALMLISLSWLFGCRGTKPEHPPQEAPLQRLGVFYGWPSLFNGATSLDQAAAGLGRYHVVVLGAGLQSSTHGDHAKTRTIIKTLGAGDTTVYGYIPLGASSGLDQAAIAQQAAAWKAMGVDGVFFDEAGHDFGNTRQRQNGAFDAAHKLGLRVFANAFDPRDLFSANVSHHNPGGAATVLSHGDSYLYESFGLIRGEPEEESFRREKLVKLEVARELGLGLYGVTTSATTSGFQPQAWRQVCGLARAGRLNGLGWGELHFAAGDNKMPPRPDCE